MALHLGASGATLSGCTAANTNSSGSSIVELRFNASLLIAGDSLKLMWDKEDYNISSWSSPKDSSSLMVCLAQNATMNPEKCQGDPSMWNSAPLLPHADSVLHVDLSGLEGRLLAIRYGWPIADGADTCCPSSLVTHGREPCVPGSCPIITRKTSLPANPFYATIEFGKCKCLPPQRCDG